MPRAGPCPPLLGYDRLVDGRAITVFGLAGSIRTGSVNARLLSRAVEVAPQGVSFDVFADLDGLPHFSQDREGDATPPQVLEMRRRIEQADALLITTPEYNSSVPGVLKNALDWASRPAGESVLADKPAAVAGASPGRFGAARAQEHVRKVLGAIGASVVDRELAVSRSHEAFDDDGSLSDAELERDLASLVVSLVELAGKAVPAAHLEEFDYSVKCQRLGRAA